LPETKLKFDTETGLEINFSPYCPRSVPKNKFQSSRSEDGWSQVGSMYYNNKYNAESDSEYKISVLLIVNYKYIINSKSMQIQMCLQTNQT